MKDFNIGSRLKDIRMEHNLKQEDIAKVLCVDRTAYSGYETGRTAVSMKNLCRLADIYKVSVDRLIGREDQQEVTKVKLSAVSAGVDPIAMLERDEQLLIMYYRLADEEEKKQIIESISKNAEKEDI